MRFRLLGTLAVWDGRCWAGVPPAKQRVLLAVLLLRANRLVAADWLIEQLWGEQPPATATNQLQVYVSRLRRRLDDRPGRILVTQSPGYQLLVGAGELDLLRFEELVAGGRQAVRDGALERAAGWFGEALGLWRGPALADVPSCPLVDSEAARLEECRLLAEEDRIEVELRRGRHGGLVGQLLALVAQQPLRERLWAQLLLALYRAGRQAEALAAYRQLHQRLAEELGIAPSPPLQRLHRQILAADPALESPSQPPPEGDAAAAPLVTPRQLPADVAAFTGRGQELAWLGGLLAADHSGAVVICAINGTGGIGKSALAIHAAHQLTSRFPDGQMYINLQGATPGLAPLSPLEVLGRFLRTLGLEPAAIPTDVQEASSLFRSLLAARRLLVVLDNAHDAAQVSWLLPASPGCAVLVTSRRTLATLDGAWHLYLDVLPVAEAMGLLGRLVAAERVAAEPTAAKRLVELCGLLPLAVRIAAARLAARPTWPLAALVERLADARRRLDELEVGELAIRACFQVSHQLLASSLDELDQQAARAFGLLGLLDTPDLSVAVAARLLEAPQDVAGPVLERLVDAQLLQTPAPGRYRFHDLLRLYAREQAWAGEDEPGRQAALTRALGWYLAGVACADALLAPAGLHADRPGDEPGVVFANRQAALGWLEAERANLVAAAGQAATHPAASIAQVAWQLGDALWRFFDLRSHWADWQAVCEAAQQAAERTGNLPTVARALGNLGIVHGQQRHYRRAVDCLERCRAICRQVADRRTEGRTLNDLGNVYRVQGRYQQALSCYEQSLVLRRAVGDRHGEGKVLNNLGDIYRLQGRYQEALDCYQRDLVICRQLGDARGEAVTVANLGHLYRAQGRYREALGYYEQSLAICRQVADRLAEANALWGLGGAVAAVQGPAAARAHWTAALGIFESLGAPHTDEVQGLFKDLGAPHADEVQGLLEDYLMNIV
jgi:DNA-binding SARP family transcriptional activator/tetratricopeptide (TPR) repeat protein